LTGKTSVSPHKPSPIWGSCKAGRSRLTASTGFQVKEGAFSYRQLVISDKDSAPLGPPGGVLAHPRGQHRQQTFYTLNKSQNPSP
jgi:hypothetical protein